MIKKFFIKLFFSVCISDMKGIKWLWDASFQMRSNHSTVSLMATLASSSFHLPVQIQDILPFHRLKSLQFTAENLRCACFSQLILVGKIPLYRGTWQHFGSHLYRWRRTTHAALKAALVIGSEVLWWTQELAWITLTWGALQVSESFNGPPPRHRKPFSLHHLSALEHVEVLSILGMSDADLSFDKVVAPRTRTLFGISVEYPLFTCYSGRIWAQRVYVCISVIGPGVVRIEATLVAADIGVSTCSIHMILHSLARTALTATSRNMLRAHLRLLKAEFARALSRCWLIHHRKTPAIFANVSISTRAIGVVNLGTPSACKYAHF